MKIRVESYANYFLPMLVRIHKSLNKHLLLTTWCVGTLSVIGIHLQYFGTRLLKGDSALFLYGGWQWAVRGDVPYRHLWDIKPPGVYLTTAALTKLTGGDQLLLYYAAAGLSAALFGALLVGIVELTYRWTGEVVAALAAGGVVIAAENPIGLAATGLEPKLMAPAVGIFAVIAAGRDRPIVAGIAGTIAPVFYQFGFAWWFAAGVVIDKHGDSGDSWKYLGISAIVGIVVLTPIILGKAIDHMLLQVIVTPFLIRTSNITIRGGFQNLYQGLGTAWPALFAVIIFWRRIMEAFSGVKENLAIAVIAMTAGLKFITDFGGKNDTLLFLILGALIVGLLVGILNKEGKQSAVRLILAILAISIIVQFGIEGDPMLGGLGHPTVDAFWAGAESGCHFHMNADENVYLVRTPATESGELCEVSWAYQQLPF